MNGKPQSFDNRYKPNRRRGPRVYHVGPLKILVQEGISFTEHIKNISVNGMSISHNGKYNFNLYEKFRFEIVLSESESKSNIQGTAQVIRMIPFQEIGMVISSIDDKNLKKLNQFIDKRLNK